MTRGPPSTRPEFDQVASLLPDGLFLPLSPSDIQLLAPQFTYFGLDTLGIQLLGTTGWTEDEVVLDVDSRHTDGVIASTTRMSQDETESFRRFRSEYETLFRKTLEGPGPGLRVRRRRPPPGGPSKQPPRQPGTPPSHGEHPGLPRSHRGLFGGGWENHQTAWAGPYPKP